MVTAFRRPKIAKYEGTYFVTLCTAKRFPLFAEERNDSIILTEEGKIAEQCWKKIPEHYPQAFMDEFVIMPNHLHGILHLKEEDEVQRERLFERFAKPVAESLSSILRNYKSAVTYKINSIRDSRDCRVWQQGFFEKEIHNLAQLSNIRTYIRLNPEKWIKGERGAM